LQVVIEKFNKYLLLNFGSDYRILTDGLWDLQVQLRSEAKRKNIHLDWHFHQYFDLRTEFLRFLPWFADSRQPGLTSMLHAFGMKFEGRQHSGIHDSNNIARLALRLIELGHPFENPKLIPDDYSHLDDKNFVDFGQETSRNSWLCTEVRCGIWNRPWAKVCKFCFLPKSHLSPTTA